MDPAIPNKTHKVYSIYLLEKLNTSIEINSIPYHHTTTKLSILFYWNICHVIKESECTKYVTGSVIRKNAHYKTQWIEYNMYSNFQ
jgi:archaellum component FlaF (FlaF/FlaG flagellin family)